MSRCRQLSEDCGWLWYVNPKGFLTAKELMRIFNYSSVAAVHRAVLDGVLPKPHHVNKAEFSWKRATCYWLAADIKKEVLTRKEKIDEKHRSTTNASN